MSTGNVLPFLRFVADRPELLDALKVLGRPEVIAAATHHGLPFTEAEFNDLIWDLESRLAERRGEAFDAHFPLWQTLWGAYYLEYLVTDLVPSLAETELT